MAFVVEILFRDGRVHFQQDIYCHTPDINQARVYPAKRNAEASARRLRKWGEVLFAEPKEVRITLV